MSIKLKVALFINKNRRNPLVKRIARLAMNVYWASEHAGYDVKRNGEESAMRMILQDCKNPVVIDVGANVGDWSHAVASVYSNAIIHAVEASPPTAQRLHERLGKYDKIHIHKCGLSKEPGEIDFYVYPDSSSELSGGRAALHSHVIPRQIKVNVISGDMLCEQNNIKEIDLLKVDVEGLDLEVLKGFSKILASGKVKAIQFELEGGNYLLDFYRFLEPLGYKIGKLYSGYVEFSPHSAESEWFLGPNYIAVHESQTSTINNLLKGWL